MFCSATPALMNRDCIASRTPSRAINPRSPVRNTQRSGARYFNIASAKGFRIAFLDLRQRLPILFGVERQVVPFHGVLHERNSVAFYGFENHYSRALAATPQRAADGPEVVAVDARHRNGEPFELRL